MDRNTIFIELRDALIELYPKEEDARVVVADAGLKLSNISFSTRAQTNWHNILTAATQENRFVDLLNVVLANYSCNLQFMEAYKRYNLFINQGNQISLPNQAPINEVIPQTDTGGGAYIAGSAEVGNDLIGRDQTNINGNQINIYLSGDQSVSETAEIIRGLQDDILLKSEIRLKKAFGIGPEQLVFNSRLITIGRSHKSKLLIEDKHVSFEHGQIILEEGEWRYRHLSESSNTQIESKKLKTVREIAKGEKIVIPLLPLDRITFAKVSTYVVDYDLVGEFEGYTETSPS